MGNLKTYTPGTYKDSEELTGLKQQANYWNGQNLVDFQYADFADSDSTNQFLSQYNNLKEPDPFTFSKQQNWDNNTYKLENMEDFSYDVNGDALYQQYKDQYTNQGKMAMMDTMGQAAAMTGGYGNSYAQSVGQQAYQGYLQQLTDKIPELYQLALSKYNSDRDNLYNMNDLYQSLYDNEYGQYRDAVDDYNFNRSHLLDAWSTSHDIDIDTYTANRDTALAENESHNKNITDNRDNFNGLVSDFANREWGMYTDQEKINQTAIDMYNSNQQWQSEFDEMVRTNNATIKTTAQQTAADNCYAAIESGVMPSDDMIKAAGLDKATVKNMVDKRIEQIDLSNRETEASINAKNNQAIIEDLEAKLNGWISPEEQAAFAKAESSEATKMFKGAIFSKDDLRRRGMKATIDGKTIRFDSYEQYVDACIDDWYTNGYGTKGNKTTLSENEARYLMYYYGIEE